MAAPTASAVLALFLLAGCREMQAPTPEYRPGEAGTVDHALCLLGFTAVPLREVSSGHHLVDATINGTAGTFVLDTGANATVIHAPHAGHFGIPAGSGGLGGAIGLGGAMQAREAAIDGFRIGPVPIRQGHVTTADLAHILKVLSSLSGETVYGIVGQDVLKEHRAVIDVARPLLYLMSADEDPAPVAAEQCRAEADG